MKYYAKIINEVTKECEVINQIEGEKLGWEQYDLEFAHNGKWYVKGYAPEKSAPTEEELQQYFEDAIEAYMDSVVQTRNYKNIHTAASYVNSTNEKFAKEGAACNKWRDDVWDKCYAILDEVKQGKRAIPTLEEVIAELPVLVW